MKAFAVILFFAVICSLFAAKTSYAEVAVGNCRPHLVSYSTISEAVVAVPANSTVLICPGIYPEQITINQPLILKGLKGLTGTYPVVTVPDGGVGTTQISVMVSPVGSGPVDISDLVVDGTGSRGTGIFYMGGDGTLENMEVRACGTCIDLPFVYGGEINIRKSNIHDFDDIGIYGGDATAGLTLNIISTQVTSTSSTVQVGILYGNSAAGLALENYYCCMTARENTVIGSNIGIYLGGSLGFSPTTVTGNILFNNGTGIFVYVSSHNDILRSNTIAQSTVAAIDANCSSDTTAENNYISSVPVGVANVGGGDTVKRNALYNVTTTTTPCTD
jgi:parallel beta-helix repeat protein